MTVAGGGHTRRPWPYGLHVAGVTHPTKHLMRQLLFHQEKCSHTASAPPLPRFSDEAGLRAGFPLAGIYRTPDGVTANVMEKLGQDWDGWTAHDDTYVVDGENVVVLARYTATNKPTGRPIDVRVAHHFVVRGGLVVRFEQFADTALVREAKTD